MTSPYQFEPTKSDFCDDYDSFNTNHNEFSQCFGRSLLQINNWCNCQKCIILPTDRECICCSEIDILNKLRGIYKCVIENPSFSKLIMDEEVIDITRKQIISKTKNKGKKKLLCNTILENKTRRYLCYKQFVFWANEWTPIGKAAMLNLKMPRYLREVDNQLLMLSDRARSDSTHVGFLHKRASNGGGWKNRYFVLYQNILFYYDYENCNKPSGVILLEGSYCSRLDFSSGTSKTTGKSHSNNEHYFVISYNHPQMRQYELSAESESLCKTWVNALNLASFNKLLLQTKELEQRNLDLLQVVGSEMTAKWQYTQQYEELMAEKKKLRIPYFTILRYILSLHEILKHTPHDLVERKSLQTAYQKLEDLSRQIHDEVSETENLRKNLSIERMIIEGCDILLDVNQIFVRQGTLMQMPIARKKSRLHFKTEKEAVRQCFLFTNHMIITTRTTSGKLHLAPEIGKISLADCHLIEDPNEKNDNIIQTDMDTHDGNNKADDSAETSHSSDVENSDSKGLKNASSPSPSPSQKPQNYDFELCVDCKSSTPITVHFSAPSLQEKTAWVSDINQCIENLSFDAILRNSMSDTSSVIIPHLMRNDPKLFKDDKDIKFSKYNNSCRIPRIHHATKEKLISRLVDLRFLSIDFLNTFLLTYRVFTDGVTILEALKKVFYNNEVNVYEPMLGQPVNITSLDRSELHDSHHLTTGDRDRRQSSVISSPRRTRAASSVSGYGSENSERDRSSSVDYQHCQRGGRKYCFQKLEEEETKNKTIVSEENSSTTSLCQQDSPRRKVSIQIEDTGDICYLPPLTISKATSSSNNETLTGDNQATVTAASPCRNNSSSTTLVAASSNCDKNSIECEYGGTLVKTSSPERKTSSPSKLHGFPIHHGHEIKLELTMTDAAIQLVEKSSTSTAAAAFAIATSASSNPRELSSLHDQRCYSVERKRKENVMSTAARMRVLKVLKHWITKHPQDFENEPRLKNMTIDFLEEILFKINLLSAECKITSQLFRLLTMDETKKTFVDLNLLLSPSQIPSADNFDTLFALEIAEQMTYIDHQIFIRIQSREFFGCAWTKDNKHLKAPHIILITKRFNELSQLVASEIMRKNNVAARVTTIEKWAAVADISRGLHNFNGVLQICSAFTISSVFRLKKTWEKVSIATKQSIQKLQEIVSFDGRFRHLREALHRCDPPCIPYLGMYLSDLSLLEEGTPSLTNDGLVNFSKLRMIAQVVKEIHRFQQTPYKIDFHPRVAKYLLDTSILMNQDELYTRSLEIEPRPSRLSITTLSNSPHHSGSQ